MNNTIHEVEPDTFDAIAALALDISALTTERAALATKINSRSAIVRARAIVRSHDLSDAIKAKLIKIRDLQDNN